MRKLLVNIGIVLLCLLGSCAVSHEFPIEVFHPAKVELSPTIKNITLVSRNLKYQNDTLQNYFSRDSKLVKDSKPVNIDSIAIQTCFDSLTLKLQAQQRFSNITALPVTGIRRQLTKNIVPPTRNFIQKIASDTQADALILLDMFSGFYSIYPVSDNGRQVAQVVTASIWTIYDPSTYRILNHSTMIDTLYWDGLDELEKYNASRIPTKKDALEIAAGMAGVKYSKNILPYWAVVYRSTLSNNQEDFKKAALLAQQNKWDEASALWETYTESKNKRCRVHALYNLAIASEMNGDIDNAIELIARASKVSHSPTYNTENKSIQEYAAVLAKRKIELSRINSMNSQQ